MDHIRTAAAISRGGLYYQYATTEEILLDLLAHARHDDEAADISSFLAEQRNALLRIDETIRPIVYDYVLGLPGERRRTLLRTQFHQAEAAVFAMLGHIDSESRRAYLARHTVRRLEGLSIAAVAASLERADLEQEISDLRAALEAV